MIWMRRAAINNYQQRGSADTTGMSHVVLREYYAHIGSLRQYLHAITDLEDLSFIDNNERLAALVLSITVASHNSWQTHTRHHAEPAQTNLSEVCGNSGAVWTRSHASIDY